MLPELDVEFRLGDCPSDSLIILLLLISDSFLRVSILPSTLSSLNVSSDGILTNLGPVNPFSASSILTAAITKPSFLIASYGALVS